MENKKGFVSTALVYSFLVIYLFLMVSIINMYLSKTTYLEALDDQVAKDIGITKENRSTLMSLIIENNVALETNLIDFRNVSNNSSKNGNGLFYVDETSLPQHSSKITDENNDGYGKKIYFFRGSVNNNNVLFGYQFKRDANGKIDKSNMKQMCWKILRTNENGSIRMIYNGVYDGAKCSGAEANINSFVNTITYKEGSETKTLSLNGKYNLSNNDNAYVGYTYSGTGKSDFNSTHHTSQVDSAVKKAIDEFYLKYTNLYMYPEFSYEFSDNSGKMVTRDKEISDALYCNDRHVDCYSVATEGDERKIVCGFGNVTTNYGYSKDSSSFEMNTYICNSFYDKYMLASETYGGNDNETNLKYAMALPTASELVMAGASFDDDNKDYFLNTNQSFWTMSASSFDGVAKVYISNSNGKIVESDVATANIGIRPVISVREDIIVNRGSGLANEPYEFN